MLQGEKILVVDDERVHLTMMADLLQDEYVVMVANSGARALEIAFSDEPPDLILLDVMMPEMDGYSVCQHLKQNSATCEIPIIFLTVRSDVSDETRGFSLGAVDYITKPISPPIVKARVRNHLVLSHSIKTLSENKKNLENLVRSRTKEIAHTQDVAIYCLTSLVEARDNETGNHIRRTQNYVKALAEKLKTHDRFCDELTEEAISLMFKSAPLHDIGKVGIPDNILLKPGKLDEDEWHVMKTHAEIGERAIRQAEDQFGSSTFLHYAWEIAFCHHEKWDGSGYPRGLSGKNIPLSGRLMALSDVYDALISERVYKKAFSHEDAVELISEGKGSHFDPDIVDAFITLQTDFKNIAQRFSD